MADMATTELAAETGKDTGNPKRARALRVLGGVVVIAALLAGLYWAIFSRGRVETDNAYVGGDTALVTPQLAGTVTEVKVGGTQAVNAGDVLVVLDDADARIAVAQAEAALAQARQRWLVWVCCSKWACHAKTSTSPTWRAWSMKAAPS